MGRVLLAALPDSERDSFLAKAKLESFTRFTIVDTGELRAVLERVKRSNYSLVDQELEIDLRALAIPIQNASGRVIAALNISARASSTSKRQMLDDFLPVMRDAAANMRPCSWAKALFGFRILPGQPLSARRLPYRCGQTNNRARSDETVCDPIALRQREDVLCSPAEF